ncbi:MAG: GTP-binding protein [Fibromonadales bacterium]|nr:GTP-binding protein [Fibromonadales bacterium]
MKKEDMNIVIVGHVDHGKSTLIGRLLADTNSLPQGKLEQVRETCRKNSKPFEYAFLLDALKDEQAQGITIDTARCFFKTEKRNYIIIDAPGHIEFLKNMVTGASRAEAALLVIDANEGVRENSRRHGYMLSMLGIKKIVVAINKLDLVNYSENVFNSIKEEYGKFLAQLSITPMAYIPVSAFVGDNLALKSENTPWHNGLTILESMNAFPCEPPLTQQVFRMPVQDVYKFTKNGDDRRIVAGTVETGVIKPGCSVVFYPSGKSSKVKNIESFPQKAIESAFAGQAVGFTLDEQIYIKRGEIMTIDGETPPPYVSAKIKVNIFWLGKQSMQKNKKYLIKLGTEKTSFVLDEILSVMNSSDLSASAAGSCIKCNEVAECIIRTDKPIAFDLTENIANTSRFVIVDKYEITGGGIVLADARDEESDIQKRVMLRNYKWEQSEISMESRAERYSQKPVLLVLTGERDTDKKLLAKELEKSLVEKNGRFAYYLGIGTFLYGVASDIKSQDDTSTEKIRRFAEVANLMLDAGMILIVTASSLANKDLKIMKTVISTDIETIWVGSEITTDLEADVVISDDVCEENVAMLVDLLKNKGYMFKF